MCYVQWQWFSLKIKQTHCHRLATTHPAVQASRLSDIPLSMSFSHTHTHNGLVARGRGELHHPSIKAVAATRHWKETCGLQDHMLILCDCNSTMDCWQIKPVAPRQVRGYLRLGRLKPGSPKNHLTLSKRLSPMLEPRVETNTPLCRDSRLPKTTGEEEGSGGLGIT